MWPYCSNHGYCLKMSHRQLGENCRVDTRAHATKVLFSFHLIALLGLDASSSLELLNHLNLVAESGRLVILTIHQPRLEIFHLFHKILFLCDGQVTLKRRNVCLKGAV